MTINVTLTSLASQSVPSSHSRHCDQHCRHHHGHARLLHHTLHLHSHRQCHDCRSAPRITSISPVMCALLLLVREWPRASREPRLSPRSGPAFAWSQADVDASWLCRYRWQTGFSSPVLHPFGIGVTLPVLPNGEPDAQWPQPPWCSWWATRGEWVTGCTQPCRLSPWGPRPRPILVPILLGHSVFLSGCNHQGRVGTVCECVTGRCSPGRFPQGSGLC